MPLLEYTCSAGHTTERIRKFAERDEPLTCHCGLPTQRVEISAVHCMPDGMYSYAPNVGSEAAFARKVDAIKNGERVYRKESS